MIKTTACLNYIGSKKSLLDFIDTTVISKINSDVNTDTKNIKFLDGFAGSGVVSKYFNSKYNYITFSNDMEYYSYILNYSNLKINYSDRLGDIIKTLNTLTGDINNINQDCLITNEFSPSGSCKRMFWTTENTLKADAIINYIKDTKNNITPDEYIFILGSIITSLDRVANTASVYGAYLKEFKKSALKPLILLPVHTNINITNREYNIVNNMNINSDEILNQVYDIVYLDPPYNERQYSSNYSPLNYIAMYSNTVETYGKTGLIRNYNKSKYCSKSTASIEFTDLINRLNTQYLLISYNNEGIIPKEDFINILSKKGKVTLYKYEYKKFKSEKKDKEIKKPNNNVFEYLYLCNVGKTGFYEEKIIL